MFPVCCQDVFGHCFHILFWHSESFLRITSLSTNKFVYFVFPMVLIVPIGCKIVHLANINKMKTLGSHHWFNLHGFWGLLVEMFKLEGYKLKNIKSRVQIKRKDCKVWTIWKNYFGSLLFTQLFCEKK